MATGNLKAQIEISADATGVDAGVGRAKRSLADLGRAGAVAGQQAAAGIEGIGAGGAEAAGKVDAATKRMIASIQRTTVALESGGRSSSKFFETIAQQRGISPDAIRPYIQALSEVEAKQKTAAGGIQAMNGQMQQFTMSTRASAAALRSVPAQITDIVTGLAAGQPPMQVLLQQGGQLKDIFGGIRPAAQALGATLLRMVTPLTAAVAALGAVGAAFVGGRSEALEYEKALILTGNAAGTTAGALQDMAARISQTSGTQGKAADVLVELAGSGRVAAESLEQVAQSAIRFERAGGQAAEKTAQQFIALGRDPLQSVLKLNETTRFLTQTTYAQIRALEDAGRVTEAATAAQNAYAASLEQRSAQIEARLGLIERAWRGVKDAAKGAWDAMLNVGRPDTIQQEIAKAAAELEQRLQRGPLAGGALPGVNAAHERGNQLIRDRIAILRESARMEERGALAQRAAAVGVEAQARLDEQGLRIADQKKKAEKEIAAARADGAAAGWTQVEIEKRVAAIREKFKDKGAAGRQLGIDKAELSRELALLRIAAAEQVAIFRGSEAILDTLRQQGLVSDREFFDAKRGFIQLNAETRQKELQAEIAERELMRLTGKEAIDNEKAIAQLRSQIVISRADAAAQLTIIAKNEQAAANQLLATFEETRQAANDALADLQRGQQRELAGFGLGNAERDRRRGRGDLDDRSNDERRRIQNERALAAIRVGGEENLTQEQRRQFDLRLQIVNDFQTRATAALDLFYNTQRERQVDMTAGMNEAFNNYVDAASRTGEAIERVFDRSLKGIEDAFVSLATKGKADFKSLVDSIVADIIRMTVQAQIAGILQQGGSGSGGSFSWASLIASIASYFNGTGGVASGASAGASAGFGFGTRANGGPVSKGRMYEINEKGGGEILNMRGRQYLMPAADGSVSPTGGKTFNQTINFVSNEPTSKRTQSQLAAVAQQGLLAGSRNL